MLLSNGCSKETEEVQPAVTVGNDSVRLKTDPIGNIDRINYNNNGAIEGWALDMDVKSTSIWVHIYRDGPAGGGGVFVGGVIANIYRGDVNNAYKVTGNHGFKFQIPASCVGYHNYYVYAINNVNGQNNPLIGVIGASLTPDLRLTFNGQSPNPATAGLNYSIYLRVTNIGNITTNPTQITLKYGFEIECGLTGRQYQIQTLNIPSLLPGATQYVTWGCTAVGKSVGIGRVVYCGCYFPEATVTAVSGESNTSNNYIYIPNINCTTGFY